MDRRSLKKGTEKGKEKYVLRVPTLRAREQFLRVEKQFESVLQKSFLDPKRFLHLLDPEDIEIIQQSGTIPADIVQKLLTKEEFHQMLNEGLTVDEELEYTTALFELAKVCIDWEQSTKKPEALLDEPIEEVVRIVSSFRATIGRR